MGRTAIDLQNRRFHKLLVLGRDGAYAHPTRQYREAMWKCQCDCGNVRTVRSSGLTSGHYKSCGCLKRDTMATFGPRLSQFKRKQGTALRNVLGHYKIRAKRKGLVFSLTTEEFFELSQKPCEYCGRTHSNKEIAQSGEMFLYNGVDRRDSAKGYEKDNCAPCCQWCNIAKFDLSVEDFLLNCRLVASHQGSGV